MGLVEREWLVTLATVEPEDVEYIDFVTTAKALLPQLKEEVGREQREGGEGGKGGREGGRGRQGGRRTVREQGGEGGEGGRRAVREQGERG